MEGNIPPNSNGNDLIFSDMPGLPLNRKSCLLYFKQILQEREIKTEDRNLVVHSLQPPNTFPAKSFPTKCS